MPRRRKGRVEACRHNAKLMRFQVNRYVIAFLHSSAAACTAAALSAGIYGSDGTSYFYQLFICPNSSVRVLQKNNVPRAKCVKKSSHL